MFFIILLRFILGYVSFDADGPFPERFINLCSYGGIKLWGISRREGGISACIRAGDYRRLRGVSRRTLSRTHVTSRHGLPFIMRRFKARPGLWAGAAAAAALLYCLSLFVWNIHIEGNVSTDTAEIQAVLESIGLTEGVRRTEVDTEKLRHELLLSMPELSWAAVNIEGTAATVDVSEAEPADKVKDDSPCNIMAASDGRIISVDVYRGTANVKEGDAVVKGDLLISGVVDHLNGMVSFMHASGRVVAETEHELSVRVDFAETRAVRNGRVKTRRVLTLFGVEIPLYLGSVKGDCELELSRSRLAIDGVNMPVIINTGRFYFTDRQEVTMSREEALGKAREEISAMEISMLGGAEIVEKNEIVQYDENGVIFSAKYLCREDISIEESILITDED